MTKIAYADTVVPSIIDLLKSCGCLDLHAELIDPVNRRPVALSAAGVPEDAPGTGASDSLSRPVEFAFRLSGGDTPLLLRDHGELLHAIHHVATAALKLKGFDASSLSFSVGAIKVGQSDGRGAEPCRAAERRVELQELAAAAILRVRENKTAYTFDPMTGAERRILHEVLVPSGLTSASSGEGFKRLVVLYPPGVKPPAGRPRPPLARGTGKPRSA